jgi:hypothetical protein
MDEGENKCRFSSSTIMWALDAMNLKMLQTQ